MASRKYTYEFDKKLILMVGNIGAGKTTYVTKLSKKYIVLSRDKIRYMIGNGEYVFLQDFEGAIWRGESELFLGFLGLGVNIVIDEINTNIYMRSRYIIDAKSYGYSVAAVVMPKLSKKESVDRRMSAPHGKFARHEWETVWEKFDKNADEPVLDEGFDKIIWLKNRGDKLVVDKTIE